MISKDFRRVHTPSDALDIYLSTQSPPKLHRRNLKTEFFEELENDDFASQCGRKTFKNGGFRKRWRRNNYVIFSCQSSLNTIQTWPVIVAFSNFTGVVWIENIWCVFRVKTRAFPISSAWCGRRGLRQCVKSRALYYERQKDMMYFLFPIFVNKKKEPSFIT